MILGSFHHWPLRRKWWLQCIRPAGETGSRLLSQKWTFCEQGSCWQANFPHRRSPRDWFMLLEYRNHQCTDIVNLENSYWEGKKKQVEKKFPRLIRPIHPIKMFSLFSESQIPQNIISAKNNLPTIVYQMRYFG